MRKIQRKKKVPLCRMKVNDLQMQKLLFITFNQTKISKQNQILRDSNQTKLIL